ncbi:MAG: LysM peptidoglycan-binding domain-containing protein [Moraxellaceae bacterium]
MFTPIPSAEDSRVMSSMTTWTRGVGQRLSLISAMALTGLLVGCSSQPVQRGQGVVIPVTNKAQQAQQARQQRATGRTFAAGQQQGLLDADSLDQLELLLEATDMQAVETNRLSVLRHGDLWERMRAGFKMNLSQSNSRIAAQQSWFVTRQSYLDRLTARASRYLYHTVSEAEKRGLPTELALLPVIESSYDPAATSNAAAAGMWQFIPSTGKIYGLRQDALYDGRRDVVESTRAAYDFLSSLYNQFGSWELALAAYNCGGGCVQRAINRNAADGLPTDFWSLRLPEETKNYVPRFLAVAQIVSNPVRHNVNFPPIANRPHFREVPIAGQVRLSDAAQLIGMTEQELYVLNPGFRQGMTTPQGPHRLLIPTSLAPHYDAQLLKLPTVNGARPTLLANAPLPAGSAVLGQSSGYSNAEAAALMGRPSAPLTVQRTNTNAGVTTQVTTRSNSASAPEITTRVQLPTNSAALAALASAASVPTGTQSRLALPVGSSSLSASNTRSVGEPPLSEAERQRIVASSVTPVRNNPQASTTAATPASNSASVVSTPTVARTEQPLNEAERQRLMQTLTATSTIAPQVSLEPALNPTEKAQLVQEIQQIAPAGTTVVDPLDGKIPLVALQTQQSVLESRGAERQVSYEQPVFSPPAASRPTSTTAATVRPVVVSPVAAPVVASKPARPKGSRTVYTVQAGDSLTALASRFKLDVAQIAEWNQMSARANLMAGTSLYLYGVTAPVEKPTSYRVQAGDTLSGVASRFGLTNQQLASYNDLTPTSNLFAGVKLSLVEPAKRSNPASNSPNTAAVAEVSAIRSNSSARSNTSKTDSYTVKRGDTLISIATAYETDVQLLAKLNDVSADYLVQLGQRLRVPEVAPKTVDYTVQRGDSLIQLATRYAISVEELAALNSTSASRMLQVGERIKLPNTEPLQSRSASTPSKANNAKDDNPTLSSANSPRSIELTAKNTTTYQVKRGDTLIGLAAEYGVEVDELAKFNKLAATATLQAGQRIKVPEQTRQAVVAQVTEYRVKSGDTLGKLASRYGVSLDELAAMNNMPTSKMLQQGERLTVPTTDDTPTRAQRQTADDNRDEPSSRASQARQSRNGRGDSSLPTQPYTVKRGDSLIGLAGTYNIDIDSLAKMNGLTSKSMLQAGQTLKVPDNSPKMADYRVRSGDTLARIATKHGITLAQLAEINELSVNAPLQIGHTLTVPASGDR